jgi:hypothetical protein
VLQTKIKEVKVNILLKTFVLFSFLLLLPVSEIFIVPQLLNDGSLQSFSLFLSFYLFITFFILYQSHIFKTQKYYFFEKLVPDNILVLLALVSFFIFLLFILKYIHSIADILIFASQYRQGFYKGSGIFTYPILIIMPSLLSIMVLKQYKLSYGFYISLLLILLATIIVGLRIYLFPIVFLYLIRMLIFSKTKKIIIVSFLLFIIMFLYKYLLNPNVEEMSILEIIGYMLGRANFRSILYFNGFEMNIEDFKCMVFPINQFFDCNTEVFKEKFLSYNPKIPIGMPFISLYSGVAIAIPKILYNLGSPLFLSIIVPYLIGLIILLKIILKSKNIYTMTFNINLFVIFIMALLEDVGAYNKLLPMMVIAFLITILFWIVNKKYILKRRKII